LAAILAPFRADGVSFLTPFQGYSLEPKTIIDIAHEAMIRCWQKIADKEKGWIQREFQDGLIWRSLAVQAGNPGAVLDSATTGERWPWYEKVRVHPAWARRYALARSKRAEQEWDEVAALMERSYAHWVGEQQQLEHEQARRRHAEERLEMVVKASAEENQDLLKRSSELSKQLEISEEAVRQFLRILGEQNVPKEQLATKLAEISRRHKVLLARLMVLDSDEPAVIRLKTEINQSLTHGDLNQGDILLAELQRLLRGEARQQMIAAAATEAQRAQLALTGMRYLDSAVLFARAARSVLPEDEEKGLEYLDEEGDALFRQGDECSDHGALATAVERFHALLQLRSRQRNPLQWGMTQNRIGKALQTLGEREDGTGRLNEAVAAYRAALQEITRGRAPLQWAVTQNNLGKTLQTLGEREGGTARLEEALAAYRAALRETTRERAPLDWAMTQNNLGKTLQTLGEREHGTARLEEAVEAYRAASQEATRVRAPPQWAMIQENLAKALQTLGGLDVADVFVSGSSQHRDLTRALATAIEAQYGAGSVWWDETDRFSSEITRALDAAKAVVVVWTQSTVTSNWVYAEAIRAASQRKAVMVRAADLDPKLIPLPFNAFHTFIAEDTRAVLDGIERRLSGEPSPLLATMPSQGFGSILLDPQQEALPARAIVTRPATLLLAKHRVVPFDDIRGLRAEFVRWATATPAHAMGRLALGRLMHAPAGLGKTRALIEIADELTRAHGWLAGFVPSGVRCTEPELSERALERLILEGCDVAGLMLIVDYAESRQADVVWLADQLVSRAERVPKPARLVLLSRGSGVWWRELLLKSRGLRDLCRLSGETYDEVEIPEEITPRDRRSLFDAAAKAFAEHLGAIAPDATDGRPPADDLVRALETESDYDRPLAVQIAALLHLAGVDADEGRHGTAGLLGRILGLEYEHWDRELRIADQPNWQAAVKNGVAQMTLAGHVDSRQAAEALIGRDPLHYGTIDIDVSTVYSMLSTILSCDNGGLFGLEPRLVGEHHVAHVVTNALVDACLDWAGADRGRRQRILTVLNRASRAEHGARACRAEAQLDRLVRTQAAALGADLIEVAFETPGPLLDLCPALEAQLGGLDEPALAAIDAALPSQSLTLMELSLTVATQLTDHARKLEAASAAADISPSLRDAALTYLADRVDTLGIRLSNLGRHEEALAASREAVDIRRRLVQVGPDAFHPGLATSLNNLGIRFSNLGRHEEALAACREAVDIRRHLAQTRPDAFLPDLATSLNNLGSDLSNLGRREEALAASQEAVDIRRHLAQMRPDAFLPDLATSLNNLGNDLSNLGRHEEALAASREGSDVRRRLAQMRPDAFLPDLAASLNNLGIGLSNLGRHEEALAASREAVDIRRRLAQRRPDAFLPDLATSLNNLGIRLSNLGRREEALAAFQEAVEIRRRLAQMRPDAFLPDLATSLSNLGNDLSKLGRLEEALAASREAVDIRRHLAQTRPDAFLPDLATSLKNLGNDLSNLGRHEEALAASREAIDIRRHLDWRL
jgi:tetratricopeptide (TPR) repeat protein